MASKLFEPVRPAKFSVNQRDDEKDIQYRILAVMLSSVPAGTMFSRGSRNLNSRLDTIIRKYPNPLINKYFGVDRRHNYSPEVHDMLSAYVEFGSVIGLTNWGSDFLYQVEEKTHEVAREIEELGLFSSKDLETLKELGKKLLTDETVSFS